MSCIRAGLLRVEQTDTIARCVPRLAGFRASTFNIDCEMLENYFPILVFLGVAGGVGLVLLALGFLFGRGSKDDEKVSPYECGFEAFEDSRMKFDVRYYLVAILFIIFDLEIAFLFPWAVSLDTIGGFGLLAMGIFLGILVVGFIYEWKKGALEWD